MIPGLRDETCAFVRMLWRNGVAHEEEVLASWVTAPGVTDLRGLDHRAKVRATREAMADGASYVLGASLILKDCAGMPDVLRLEHDGYVAGDVKSGGAFVERAAGPVPRLGYGVQVAHYAHMLSGLGLGPPDRAFIVGADTAVADYDLTLPLSRAGLGLLEEHAGFLAQARAIRDHEVATRPAVSTGCKMCHWRSACRKTLTERGDPTLIAGLGRAARDSLDQAAPTMSDLANLKVDAWLDRSGKSLIPGIGAGRLARFRERAILLGQADPQPYARRVLDLPALGPELHLDLETDPLRGGLVYLHGVWERDSSRSQDGGRFVHFFAGSHDEEAGTFAAALAYLEGREGQVIHWSAFERTAYRVLQKRYPHVCSPGRVEALFDGSRSTDLYSDVVLPHTEWPAGDFGLKTIAKLCGFGWRDDDPGGANSIEWFDRWLRDGDETLRRRILKYNEDDCRATAAVLDVLRTLPVR